MLIASGALFTLGVFLGIAAHTTEGDERAKQLVAFGAICIIVAAWLAIGAVVLHHMSGTP